MVERHRFLDFISHSLLALGVLVIVFPIYLALIGSTHSAQEMAQSPIPIWFGQDAIQNYRTILLGEGPGVTSQVPVARMMWVSLVTALSIAFGKIVISLLSAFAIVYFNFPFRKAVFWGIFITLMLPVEVRIVPTYKVVADFGMINSFAGLTIPLIASATATFLFRQFFMTVPDELTEAAKMDGASPMRFFWDVLLPLSRTSIAALFVIQFIYGWNQYLWPLLVTTSEDMYPVVLGIKRLISGESWTEWNVVMAAAILAMLPPALVVVLMQKWFVKGLVDTEK
jgi:sn-glycerol 3-phosphate transport system permease protein